MIRYILLFVCSIFPLLSWSQDKAKENKQADAYNRKTLMRSVKEFHKAQNYAKIDETLTKAFSTYAEARGDAQLMNYELDALYGLMQAENTHIFLNNRADTAKFFSYILKTYECGLRLDTLDSKPDEKGRIKQRYRENITAKLSQLRNNLRSGGKFHYKKKNYADAYRFFEMYLRTMGSPLVKKTAVSKTSRLDADSVAIARLAVLSAFEAKQYGLAIQFLSLAHRDTTYRMPLLELQAICYRNLADSARYVGTLTEGFGRYPQNEHFYSPLISHYDSLGQYRTSMQVVNRLIRTDSTQAKFWYLKGKLYQALELPDSAIEAYQQTVSLVDTIPEVYSSLGDMFTIKAHRFYLQADLHIGTPEYWTNRNRLNAYYESSCKAYEKARSLAPERSDLWLAGLREAYFRLNRGKELKALEKVTPPKK